MLRKKGLIEQAYSIGESVGLAVYCEDEAGPYQAIPQPGESWQPVGHPAVRPHEYIRGGTAKLLTLFRPADGELICEPVARTPNDVLHPWLKEELEKILAEQTKMVVADVWRDWRTWGYSGDKLAEYDVVPSPHVRMLLVLDNLKGHHTKSLVGWCLERGVALLYTPLGGSWLNMAESVQRIIVRRALYGQRYQSQCEMMEVLRAVVRGWNRQPTPFIWGGKRKERRERARGRRHMLGGSGACTIKPIVPRGVKKLQEAA